MKYEIPQEVCAVVQALQKAGHTAYAVGGCVRDILRGAAPKDWDVATSAKPEEILKIFQDGFYENKFLTVTARTASEDPPLKEIQITTFRAEGKYTDKRHPDEVRFAETLEEDLSRRDFTVNALALSVVKGMAGEVIDPFDGQSDLQKKLIRAVGDPEKRFDEDALRMMRAARFFTELDFTIESETKKAIETHAGNIRFIAKERIRDEFVKIIATPRAKDGVALLQELGLLQYIVPELEEGIGVENRPRIFTIWEHNLKALEYGAKTGFPFDVRIAALLHDVGKPRTKGPMKNNEWTFYGHDVVGSRMATEILERLHFPRATVEKIATLVRWHLFKYEQEEGEEAHTTDASIRRLIRNVGASNMDDLVKLRVCDRMGMGVPKAMPYRLRHFQFRVEKILREEEVPHPKMLKVKGEDVMRILQILPGPKVGRVLEVLLQGVIDYPSSNTKEFLEGRIRELGSFSEEELTNLAETAEQKVEMREDERVSSIKAKYYVQ